MKSTGIIVATGICLLSWAIGYIFWSERNIGTNESITSPEASTEVQWIREWWYKYINPLLECETANFVNNRKYISFERDAIEKIKKEVQDKNPDIKLSLYFRNLNNGPWFGINEQEQFFPASLIKLPILIMYLKWAELDPTILLKEIQIAKLSEVAQIYKWEKSLELGKTYTVKNLLEYLIVYSENSAINPLLDILPKDIQVDVFDDLWVPIPTKDEYQITTKDYASFFRILYNASYLSKSLSENALALLSQTTFDDGLRGTIPKEVIIAHKFGEREIIGNNKKIMHQLHDCGIIYYPGYPYLICVMTKGEDVPMPRLAWIIKKSSSIIYDEISARYPYSTQIQK